MAETEIKKINGRSVADTTARDAIAELKQYSWVSAESPLVLNADKAEEYNTMAVYGDRALRAIQEGRQILVRVPNADGGKYTAIYSPVLMYQLPNYENNYLYLFYFRDEKQDLSALLGQAEGTVQMPQYGELKMLLSETYNGSPLGQPYINTIPAVGSAAGTNPVCFGISTIDEKNVLSYYDNPDRLATVEEVVDAYMTGNAFVFYHTDAVRLPHKIEHIRCITDSYYSAAYFRISGLHYARIEGSTDDSINAAIAKYLP